MIQFLRHPGGCVNEQRTLLLPSRLDADEGRESPLPQHGTAGPTDLHAWCTPERSATISISQERNQNLWGTPATNTQILPPTKPKLSYCSPVITSKNDDF